MEGYFENIKNYTNSTEFLLKKLSFYHKNLFIEMNQVSLRMKELSEIYSQLYDVSMKTNDVLKLFNFRILQLQTHIKC